MYTRIKATWQKRATYVILKQIKPKGRWIAGNQSCFPYPEYELVLQSCKKSTTKTLPRALVSKLAVHAKAVPDSQHTGGSWDTQPSTQHWWDTPGVLCPALVSPGQERCGPTEGRAAEDQKDDQGFGESDIGGEARQLLLFCLEKRKLKKPDGGSKDNSLTLLKRVQDKKQWVQTEIQEIPLKHKKKLLFCCEAGEKRGCKVSTLGDTQNLAGMVVSNLFYSTLLLACAWTTWSPEASSNPNYSLILW